MNINKTRNLLYTSAKILGDINAIQKGNILKRIINRILGRITGKLMGKITKYK